MSDREASVRIIDHLHTLTSKGARDSSRLQDECDLVVLERKAVRDCSLLFPSKHIVQNDIALKRSMGVSLIERRLAETSVVIGYKSDQKLVAILPSNKFLQVASP